MREFAVQILGFLALALYLASYQFKSNRVLIALQMLGAILFAAQYALLGAATGCFSQILKVIRSILMLKSGQWLWVRSKGFPITFSAIYILIAALTWAGPLSLAALGASVASTIAFWSNNARTIRLSCLVVICPCWLIYAGFSGSWGGILNEVITIASILISIYRFGWKALGEPQE